MEEIKGREGLLRMIAPVGTPMKVLVIESLFYLPELCRMLPNASISAVTIYEEVLRLKSYRELPVEWHFLDFRKEEIPCEKGSFDLMLAESCLTDALEPYELLTGLGRLLRDTGSLITEFRNIRYWRVLEGLREGFFPERQRRLYAKSEVVRLLNDAIFKEIAFVPFSRDPAENSAEWEQMGFDNFSEDLCTERWMIRADRSSAEVSALKSFYSAETRKCLSRLLHRVEYGVEPEKSLAALWELCREEGIFADYLGDFARGIIVHPEALHKLYEAGRRQGMNLQDSED